MTTQTPTTKAVPVTTVVTPEFRLSYPNLFVARAMVEGQKLKYSIGMIFPKVPGAKTLLDSVPANIKAAVSAAIVKRWGADKAKWPKPLNLPFRDGAESNYAAKAGYGPNVWFMNATSEEKPFVYDQAKNLIIDPRQIVGGYYCYASINAFAYPGEGKKSVGKTGVTFGLNGVQLVRQGEPFSNRGNVESHFQPIAQPEGTPAGLAGDGDSDSSGGIEDLGL